MSTRRTLVQSIAIAVAVAAVLAFLFGRKEPELEPDDEVAEVEAPEPQEAPTPAPEPIAKPTPTPREPAPVPVEPATAEPAPPPEEIVDSGPAEPFTPELREHALLMITPMAKMAMEANDVTQLKSIRDLVTQRKEEKLMSASDLEALDLAIGCIERSPEAREEARDLIEFGQPTQFGDSFKKACGQ